MLDRLKFNSYFSSLQNQFARTANYLTTHYNYMHQKVENYLVGDLRQAMENPSQFLADLKVSHSKSFGYLGQVILLQPVSAEALGKMLDEIDKQPTARIDYQSLSQQIGGSAFLAEHSSVDTLQKKRRILSFINHPNFFVSEIKHALDFMIQGKHKPSITSYEFSSQLVRNLLAKLLFDVDYLTPENHQLLDKLGMEFETNSAASSLLPELFKMNNTDLENKAAFERFSLSLLQAETSTTLEYLHSYANSSSGEANLTGKILLDILKRENISSEQIAEMTADDVRKYYSHPELKSLPWAFLAADNIAKVVKHALTELKSTPRKLFDDIKIVFNEYGELDADLLAKNVLLENLYQYHLQQAIHNIKIVRYAKQSVQIGNHTIPAKTTLIIQLSTSDSKRSFSFSEDSNSETLEKFRFFSAGKRRCPGEKVSEYIFKAIVAEYIRAQHVQLKPIITPSLGF